jgi:hypothetical protein
MTIHTLADNSDHGSDQTPPSVSDPPTPSDSDSEPERPGPSNPHDLIRQLDDPVSEDMDARLSLLARIDPAEQAKSDAIFSYNVMDIIAPPLKLTNPYNPRPVMKPRVSLMRNALLQEGFQVFSNENRIMIVINPSDVDPSCITLDPTAPPKPLLLKRKHKLSSLTIIGGQHRRAAVELIQSEYKTKMDRLRVELKAKFDILKDFEKKPPKTEDALELKDRLEIEVVEDQRDLEGHQKAMKMVGPWGVMLLDARE